MREDMAKVLVERPRRGGGVKYPRHAGREPLETRPRREPIKSRYISHPKWLNENLAPLRRFLRSKVGHPWDDVYSEICQRINRDSPVQLHIWQHLMREVTQDPVRIAKILGGVRVYGWGRELYVDPRTGRLEECKVRRPADKRDKTFVRQVDDRHYKKIDGLWYEIDLKPLPGGGKVHDVILSGKTMRDWYVEASRARCVYGRPVYAVRKRQLNTKEIRRLEAALATQGRGGARIPA